MSLRSCPVANRPHPLPLSRKRARGVLRQRFAAAPIGWFAEGPAVGPAGLLDLLAEVLRAVADGPPAEAFLQPGSIHETALPVESDFDRRDIEASLGGDGEAYARLVGRYQQEIGGFMWRFTRDRRQWEELIHEVFVEAYFSLRGYRAQSPLLHWLRRIATRVGYRWWKQRARRRQQEPLPLAEWDQLAVEPHQANAQEAAEVVHAILERMAPRDRLVLTLLYLEECSVAEIAARTGWTQTMVKVQAHRARKRLKRLCERAEEER
ncbi:MAG: sigma-70 family RNA polymerase sigma factor [Pirellulales bacterium]|nr:sigma-70 family RNA polymerase sigma factor [Pirellulales bacterium]